MADNYDQIMPTYAPSMVALQNRQKMADLLRQQSMESPKGDMVSGHYVAPSWTQYAAQLLKGYMGGKMSDEATQGQADLGKQLQAAKAESVNNMINTMPGSQYATNPDKQANADKAGEALFQGADVTSPEAQSPIGQTVMQTRPNSDQDVTKWMLTAQQANPEGAGVAMKMYEMQQQREATKQQREAALSAALVNRQQTSQQNLENKKDLMSFASDLKNTNQQEQPPKAAPGTRVFKDDSGNWQTEILHGSPQWQTQKSKESTDRAFVQNIVPTFEKNINDIKNLTSHEGFNNLFGRIGSIEALDALPSTRNARAQLAQVTGAMETSGMQLQKSTAGSAGSMTEKEWPKMQSYLNIAKTTSDPEEAKRALESAAIVYKRMATIAKDSYANEWGTGQFGDMKVIDRLNAESPVPPPQGGGASADSSHPADIQAILNKQRK
jgi:hypothetical protein